MLGPTVVIGLEAKTAGENTPEHTVLTQESLSSDREESSKTGWRDWG